MSGLFVQKHADAVHTQDVDVRVIFSQEWRDTWRQWKELQREGWIPDVVQLNVIQKQGALALWLKKRFGIPYIIVEHWSGYLPDNGQFMQMSRLKKRFIRCVCREAEQVLTVSRRLQAAMQECGLRAKRWDTIDNVVDDFFFERSTVSCPPSDKKTLIHVSCFDEQAKNVKGLLRAAKMLHTKRQDWQLILVGTGANWKECVEYTACLELEDMVHFTGELPPKDVAAQLHQADALVLSSQYETYGVVLAEAAAAGIPILSTPVGIAEEVGALIVPQEIALYKPGTFAEFIETILWHPAAVSSQPKAGSRFSAEIIGKKLRQVYDSCLHRDI